MQLYINKRYRLVKRLYQGNYGVIYEGFDEIALIKVAIKMEGNTVTYPQIFYEAKCLKSL